MTGWVSILAPMILAGGGFLIFCIGAFWRTRSPGVLFSFALIVVCCAAAGTALTNPQSAEFLGMLEVQGYGRFFTFLIVGITGLALLFVHSYAQHRDMAGDELYGLILLAAFGMVLVAGAIHWLSFFLGLEILSLSLYVLIPSRKDDVGANEAGIKYFIMGAVSGAFLAFGIAILYALTGTLDIAKSLSVGAPAGGSSLVFLGLALILSGIGFKISLVPFHLWTPDVYQGAPSPITGFLATGSKVALFAALLRFACYSSDEIWAYLTPPIWILAVLTMGVGTISALSQGQVKRLLAYSSIAQMGYLLMTLLAVKQNGSTAILFYLTVYALMDLGAFGTLTLLSAEKTDLDSLTDFQGLAYAHPWRSAVLAISLLSLAGLPPTAGFIGKFSLFWAVLQARFLTLGVIGILTATVSIYFYFKVIVALFMRDPSRKVPVPPLPLGDRFAGGLVLLLILMLGLFPGPIFRWIEQAIF